MIGRRPQAHLRRSLFGSGAFGLVCLCAMAVPGFAQITFHSAIDLALRNSPRVKLAADDFNRANAQALETKDAYIPSVVSAGGAGDTYGITLTVPTIFTLTAQSLIFSYSQRDYVRAAKLDIKAAGLTLADSRAQVEEDVAVTYITLNSTEVMATAVADEVSLATKLESVVEQRMQSGLENQPAVDDAHRTVLQTRLQEMQLQDQAASLREHLAQLVGLPGAQMLTVAESIPHFAAVAPLAEAPVAEAPSQYAETPSLLSAEAKAQAKQERAFGDARYTWRPQVNFYSQYGRVSPINDVSEYYDLHGKYNTAVAGFDIQLPLLDVVHKRRAQESAIDAAHAVHEAELLRSQQVEDDLRMDRSLMELQTKTDLAELDYGSAQNQLKAIEIQAASGGYSGPAMTPKEEANARIEERQKYVDLTDAKLQMHKTQIFLSRQKGELDGWLQGQDASQPVIRK